jgi:hypothetical protein
MHSSSEAAPLPLADADRALWNPAVAACWSVVFTPALGAWVVMRNWETLGDAREAMAARKWFCFSLGLLVVQLLSAAFNTRLNSESNLLHWLSLLNLLAWSVAAALPQARAVKARFGAAYARKAWDQVLLAAVLAGTGYFAVRGFFTFLFVALT